MIAGAGGAALSTGGARQPSGFNNSVRGGSATYGVIARARVGEQDGPRRGARNSGPHNDGEPNLYPLAGLPNSGASWPCAASLFNGARRCNRSENWYRRRS